MEIFKINNFVILNSRNKIIWENLLNKLKEYSGQNVYYTLDYLKLYEKEKKSTSEAFVYHNNGEYFFITYLKNLISKKLTKKDCYDFETPYGYSGPISTTSDTFFLNEAWNSFENYCKKFCPGGGRGVGSLL